MKTWELELLEDSEQVQYFSKFARFKGLCNPPKSKGKLAVCPLKHDLQTNLFRMP